MSKHQPTCPPGTTHILVVEDDKAVGEMLTLLLEAEGYRVTLVPTAHAALDMLLPATLPHCNGHSTAGALPSSVQSQPAMVLLDLQLPGMSGEEMIEHLSKIPRRIPPIIVLSAKRQAALELAATMPGVAAVIAKPFPIDALLDNISTVLQQQIADTMAL